MQTKIMREDDAIFEGDTFTITTILLYEHDELVVEWWYKMKGYGVARLAYGCKLEDEIKDNSTLEPCYEIIADYIEWDAIEKER